MNRARSGVLAAIVVTVAVLGTGCRVWLPPADPGGSCPEGSHALQHADVTAPLSTPYGTATVTLDSSALTLAMSGGAWTLQGDETLTITASTIVGNLTATAQLDGSAAGTYAVSGSELTFTLTSLSGSATISGAFAGTPFSFTGDLSDLGDLSSLYGLSGTVPFDCDASGGLTLTFPDFAYQF